MLNLFTERPKLSVERDLPWLYLLLGMLAMYLPTFFDLSRSLWSTSEQGQGPIVLALAIWLFYRKWPEWGLAPVCDKPPVVAWQGFILAVLLYVVGRVFDVWLFEVGSIILLVAAVVLLLRGWRALKAIWFPLFFLLFLVPLPAVVVDALTQPMKAAVSASTEYILFHVGYPISRTGVMLQIGPYQLLVADACAGLHTLFTLEAIGLLYLNVVKHSSALRNIGLAILIVPISFTANVIRVIVLSLVTFHLGDAAGQGFLHGFAGMVLFVSALSLIILVDTALRSLNVKKKTAT